MISKDHEPRVSKVVRGRQDKEDFISWWVSRKEFAKVKDWACVACFDSNVENDNRLAYVGSGKPIIIKERSGYAKEIWIDQAFDWRDSREILIHPVHMSNGEELHEDRYKLPEIVVRGKEDHLTDYMINSWQTTHVIIDKKEFKNLEPALIYIGTDTHGKTWTGDGRLVRLIGDKKVNHVGRITTVHFGDNLYKEKYKVEIRILNFLKDD